jgi:hypothetical protein
MSKVLWVLLLLLFFAYLVWQRRRLMDRNPPDQD